MLIELARTNFQLCLPLVLVVNIILWSYVSCFSFGWLPLVLFELLIEARNELLLSFFQVLDLLDLGLDVGDLILEVHNSALHRLIYCTYFLIEVNVVEVHEARHILTRNIEVRVVVGKGLVCEVSKRALTIVRLLIIAHRIKSRNQLFD
jgi:hypothetical protein